MWRRLTGAAIFIFALAVIVSRFVQSHRLCDKWSRVPVIGQVRLGTYKDTTESLKDAQTLRGLEVIVDVVPNGDTWQELALKDCRQVLIRRLVISKEVGEHLCKVGSIEVLRIHDCTVEAGALNGIGRLSNLRDLNVGNCTFSSKPDVDQILEEVGPQLVYLDVNKVPIDSLPSMTQCDCLEVLTLYNSGFKLSNADVVSDLPSLRRLTVWESAEALGEAELDEIKRRFPGIVIDDGKDH